jgi:alpha-beta hydrolase superfamily lysophospholipase
MVNQLLETSYPFAFSPRLCASIVFHLPYPLPSSVSCNPFACHSCENTGGGGVFFPFWDSFLDVRTFRRSDVQTTSSRISPTSETVSPYLWIATMRRRLIRIALILLLFPPILAAVAGWLAGPAFLHPIRRELTPDLIREADASFAVTGATREDFAVTAPDGVLLRGWKVRPKNPNGNWILVFHGVADNRVGVIGQSEFLLRAGYSILMMDARAHGASGGPIATYGWLERNDTRAIIDALVRSEVGRYEEEQIRLGKAKVLIEDEAKPVDASYFHLHSLATPRPGTPAHIFALGESMGAGIVLQSAAVDPRIEAVVAEAPFANLREAAYDYAGLRKYPWLGKTLFAPGTWTLLYRDEKLAGFPVAEVSPVKAVAARAFPVLLICDEKDEALPCRHSEMIYAAARGPKQLWVVPRAFHTAAYGFAPEEFRRRVLSFFATYATANSAANSGATGNPAPAQNKISGANPRSKSGSDDRVHK